MFCYFVLVVYNPYPAMFAWRSMGTDTTSPVTMVVIVHHSPFVRNILLGIDLFGQNT